MTKYESFVNFSKMLVDKPLKTLWMHKEFRLSSISAERFEWILGSTGKHRYSRRKYLEAYFRTFEKVKSLHPKDYKEMTTNDGKKLKTTEASYILTLISIYNKSN